MTYDGQDRRSEVHPEVRAHMIETSERLTRLETLGEQTIVRMDKIIDDHEDRLREHDDQFASMDKKQAILGLKVTGFVSAIVFTGSWIKNHLTF